MKQAMWTKGALVVALVAWWIPASAWADSPLTSTEFSVVYMESSTVPLAAEDGLADKVLAALVDPSVGHGERAAIINAMGWDIAGQENGKRFLTYVAKRHDAKPRDLRIADLSAEEVFALGYLVAMDDYMSLGPIGGEGEVEKADAASLLAAARRKAPKSYAIALVEALVKAQVAMASNWCQVYRSVHQVVTTFDGERDMDPRAVEIIMEYVDLYKPECDTPRPVQGP